jgi:hypothetical protein
MALVRFRGMPAQLTPFFRFSGPVGARFWRTGIAFLAVYFAMNMLTEWHEFDRLGITLWSPDNGLSLVPHESPHFLKGSCWPYFAAKS